MTLTQLRTFLAVAETGSVRAAAARLVVTESAVSAALAALQKSLALQLVRPAGRGLELTEAGRVYFRHVRQALGLLDAARTIAAGEADPEGGEVRIGAVTAAGEQLLPGLLARFRRRHPRVRTSLAIANRESVLAMLTRHEVDLALGGRPAAGLATHAVRANELVLVAGAGAEADLETWLLREPGSGTRATAETLLDGLRISPPTLTIGSSGAIREAVIAGLGVSLMSRDAVSRELESGQLRVLDTPRTPLRRDWHLVAPPGPLPATPRLFVRHAVESGEFTALPGR